MSFRVCHANHSREPELEEKIKVFYDLDCFGVRAAPHRLGAEEQRALDVLKRTTRKVGDRYETGLLWNDEAPKLPESRGMCLQRAKGLQQRMAKDPELGDKLQELVESYVRKGYCTDVTGVPPKDPCWYLPVFPVIKPGEVRLVFHAAAKSSDGRSLNSFLLSGPDMLNPLPEVIIRFREKRVGVSADVCEMFHQVRIRAQDRDAQRFLWWPLWCEISTRTSTRRDDLRRYVLASSSPVRAEAERIPLPGQGSRGEGDPEQLLRG